MKIGTFLIGLALLLAGVVALLVNLGYGSWEFLSQVTRLWPVVLILVGLGLFWGGRIPRWLALSVSATFPIELPPGKKPLVSFVRKHGRGQHNQVASSRVSKHQDAISVPACLSPTSMMKTAALT